MSLYCPVSEGPCAEPGEAPTCTSNAGCYAFLAELERRMADEGYCGSCYEFMADCWCDGGHFGFCEDCGYATYHCDCPWPA